MSLVEVPQIAKYGPGADLWVFPDLNNSYQLRQIDWFLNFQLTISSQKKDSPGTTLVSADKKLPTRSLLSLPFDGDIKTWCKALLKHWNDLGQPRLRVFAPDSVTDILSLEGLHQHNSQFSVVI